MSLILSWLTSKIAGPIAAALAILFALGFAWQTAQIDGWPMFGGGYKTQVAALQGEVAAAALAQAKFAFNAQQAIANFNALVRKRQDGIAAAYQDGLNHSQTITQTIIRKVPVYVSEKSDAACVVPVGAIRVFDAAASGSDPSAVAAAIAPGQPDDAASGIPLSRFVAMLVQNFSAGRDNADQLSALQTAIKASH